ncbi:MAG: hypothetical protein IPO52_14250 [Gemmatimonadetes bacterium]|nr:hypothetical protein [Gemmatimonadota bacterium]
MGGLLAMLYAVTHPTRVASLALVSPAPAAKQERAVYEAALAARNATPELLAQRKALQESGLRAHDIPATINASSGSPSPGYFHEIRRVSVS